VYNHILNQILASQAYVICQMRMIMPEAEPYSPLPTPFSQRIFLPFLPPPLQHPAVHRLLLLALAEDLNEPADPDQLFPDPSHGDITSQATLPPAATLDGRITAKAEGVIAGLPIAQAVFYLVDPSIVWQPHVLHGGFQNGIHVHDGAHVQPGDLLAEVSGPGTSLLTAERTALNFLGRMSGIATLTHKFVQAVAGTRAVILDTRKTAPGLRHIDKYAVRMGGGQNHRLGLFDMVLIKDNHIDGADGIRPAVEGVRSRYGSRYLVEVEVKNLDELRTALALPVDRILLDNMDLDTMRQAVELAAGRLPLEASGNVTLATVRSIAETGVDFISSGALTHSAPVLDISMRLR
jgi:nicotinate-nucleotide pyrophosphorylase (carboxylating)